jgi:hypothetical protein
MCLQPCVERREVAVGVLIQVALVQAVCGMEARFGFTEFPQFRPAGPGDGGNEHFHDARRVGVVEHLRTITIEFRCVEVRMAVEDRSVWAKSGHWSTLK